MKYRRLYTIIVIAGSIAIITACVIFLFFSYESLIRLMLSVSGKPYLESLLRQKIFTVGKYALLRIFCFIILALVPVFAALLLYYQRVVLRYFRFAAVSLKKGFTGVKKVFAQNSKVQNGAVTAVLLLTAARSLYYIIQYDLQYDELWSYNYFTAQPVYYPVFVSSNYPLYEISTGLFKYLPFDMKINIRLPVLMAGLVACVILYACLRKYFRSHIVAMCGMALFAFMPVTAFYMLYARGVMYSMVFAIIAVFALLFWIKNQKDVRYLVIYAVANGVGVYAMPTHIYLWVILFLFMLMACYKDFKSHWKYMAAANAGAGVISFLLYAPILAGSGVSLLLNAATDTAPVRPTPDDLIAYNREASLFFTGYAAGFLIIMAAAFLILLITKKFNRHRVVFFLGSSLCLLPATIYFFQHIQIPMRALAFVGLFIPLLFSAIIRSLTGKLSNVVIVACITVLTGGTAYITHRHHYLNWSIQTDKQTKQLAVILLQHRITTCYDNSTGSGFFYYYPALEYYYKMNHQSFQLYTSDTGSLRYKPLTVSDKYDCLAYYIDDTVNRELYTVLYSDRKSGFTIVARKR